MQSLLGQVCLCANRNHSSHTVVSSQASQTIDVVDESPRDLRSEEFADEANIVRASDR